MAEPPLAWREPEPADAEAIGLMHHRAWVDTYSSLLPAGWFEHHGAQVQVDLWRRVLAEPVPAGVRRIAVFDLADRPVGWAVCGPGRVNAGVRPVRERALWGLYVETPRLGSGLGQALLDWAVGDAPAELWTARGNARAVAFYRRNGFSEDGVAVLDEHVPLVEIRMVR